MTISTTTSRAQYNGNGVTTIFSFPYLFLANGDLEVRLIAVSGASTVLTLTTDYTVTGANNDAGGSVTMIVAPASGEQLLIRRIVDLTQETAYPSGDSFPAESHERALDKLTMIVQQHDEEFARTLQLPPESDVDASTINVEAVEVVAGIAADVSAVAAIDDDVVITADNIAAILAAPAQAAAAAASAVAADASADAAAASAALIALPLPISSGGTGQTTAAAAFTALKQAATETSSGVFEVGTTAEVQAATSDAVVVTPLKLKDAQIQLGTALASTSGSTVEFTGLPTWAKRVTISFVGLSTTGSAIPIAQLGTSVGFVTSGYLSSSANIANAATPQVANSTSGIGLTGAHTAAVVMHGSVTFTRVAANTWIGLVNGGRSDAAASFSGGGSIALGAAMDRIRLLTPDAFDLGTVNIAWE